MSWYRKEITKFVVDNYKSFLFVVIFPFILLLWNRFTGKTFVWKEISPLSTPEWQRYLYSAFTYVSLGWILYQLRFYQLLYFIFVKVLGNYRSFKEVKGVIWVGLMLLMYYKIVPWFVTVLNHIISFGYNFVGFLLFLSPVYGITFVIFTAIVLLGSGVQKIIVK